jgi:hypothetical protein
MRPSSRVSSARGVGTSKILPFAQGISGGTDCDIPDLLERATVVGISVTTNGNELRLRQFRCAFPDILVGEIQLRQREVLAYLMRRLTPRGIDQRAPISGSSG